MKNTLNVSDDSMRIAIMNLNKIKCNFIHGKGLTNMER